MQCRHCNSEWKSKDDSSISVCPFCGKSLIEEGDSKFYENSKDALAAIMKRFGADILLGKLSAHFSDLAPSVPQSHKKLVYAVNENGASKVLKENMNGTQEDKESAVKLAVRKLTDAYIAEEAAETIIHEFAAALGWQVNRSKYNGTLTGKDGKTTWTYTGDIQDGKRHGKGKCEWSDGMIYEGDWVNDKFHGKGKYTDKYKTYEGDYVENEYHGKGKYTWTDGTTYEGDFVKGNKHGKGKYVFCGETYEGDFVENEYHGKGKMINEDGDVYEGDWADGKKHGKGKYTWTNGDVYEGDWVDGKRTGKGKYTDSNGGFYEGDYVESKRHGKGKTKPANTNFYHEGNWVEDKKHGKGKLIYEDGFILEIDYVDDLLHGKGKITHPDGTVEEGRWENDKYIG